MIKPPQNNDGVWIYYAILCTLERRHLVSLWHVSAFRVIGNLWAESNGHRSILFKNGLLMKNLCISMFDWTELSAEQTLE